MVRLARMPVHGLRLEPHRDEFVGRHLAYVRYEPSVLGAPGVGRPDQLFGRDALDLDAAVVLRLVQVTEHDRVEQAGLGVGSERLHLDARRVHQDRNRFGHEARVLRPFQCGARVLLVPHLRDPELADQPVLVDPAEQREPFVVGSDDDLVHVHRGQPGPIDIVRLVGLVLHRGVGAEEDLVKGGQDHAHRVGNGPDDCLGATGDVRYVVPDVAIVVLGGTLHRGLDVLLVPLDRFLQHAAHEP